MTHESCTSLLSINVYRKPNSVMNSELRFVKPRVFRNARPSKRKERTTGLRRGGSLSQPQVRRSAISNQTSLTEESSRPNPGPRHSRVDRLSSPGYWDTEAVLDTTYNRLQELMQLLYLLSRDPTVPNDARYHVTVAQSEIALLTRQMHNATSREPGAESVERG